MDLRTVGDGFSFQPWYSKPLKHLLMSRWNKRDLCARLCALLNQNIFADGCLQTTWETTCADFSGGSRGWETAWSPQEAWSPQASQELFCQLSGQNREVTRSPSLQLSLVLIWLLSCSAHRAVGSHQAHPNVYTFPSAPGRLGSVNLWFCDLMNLWCYDSHSLLGGIWTWIIQEIGQNVGGKFLWCYRSYGRCSIVTGMCFLAFI